MPPNRCVTVDPASLPDELPFDGAAALTSAHLADMGKPWDRRLGVYHPSSIAGCRRALYYDRLGVTPKRSFGLKTMRIFELGHAIHTRVQGRLREAFPNVGIEVPAVSEALHLSGSSDAVFWEEDWLLDIKTIGTTSFSGLVAPHSKNLDQVHCYMWCLEMPRSQILYIDRDKGLMRSFRIPFQMERWVAICERISFVEEHLQLQKPPEKEGATYDCYQCNFQHICKPEGASA